MLVNEIQRTITRRHFFRDCGVGVGKIALASLLAGAFCKQAKGGPLAPRKPHFAPKARNVIHLFMAGAPSQLDLFDYKPTLAKYEGKPIPPEIIKGQRYAFIRADAACLGPQYKFGKHGKCGAELSEIVPYPPGRAYRPVQPRAGTDLLEHRLRPTGPAQHRFMGDVWPRRGNERAAGIRRDVHRRGH
jgi:hypothetical protein